MTALCWPLGCAYMPQTGSFWIAKLFRGVLLGLSCGAILVLGRDRSASDLTTLFAGQTTGKEAEDTIEGDAKAGAAASKRIGASAGDQFEHLAATRQPIQMTRNQSNRE